MNKRKYLLTLAVPTLLALTACSSVSSMYSSDERIDIWRTFLACTPDPITARYGNTMTLRTYTNKNDIAVAICEVQGEGHILQNALRSKADSIALTFMHNHKKQ